MGEGYELNACTEFEFGEDAADVRLHSAFGYEEILPYLDVAKSFSSEDKHLHFARGQDIKDLGIWLRLRPFALEETMGVPCSNDGLPFIDRADGGEQEFRLCTLEEEPARPGLNCPDNGLVLVVRGESDDARR